MLFSVLIVKLPIENVADVCTVCKLRKWMYIVHAHKISNMTIKPEIIVLYCIAKFENTYSHYLRLIYV